MPVLLQQRECNGGVRGELAVCVVQFAEAKCDDGAVPLMRMARTEILFENNREKLGL